MSAWWRLLDSARADEELCEEFVDHRPYEIVVVLEIKRFSHKIRMGNCKHAQRNLTFVKWKVTVQKI
jgi:hypothetical protein